MLPLLDSEDLRQFIGANWVSVGSVSLKAGKHTVRIESTENNGAIAFDAFLLTRVPFTARGKLKPGEKYGRTNPGWFAFEPEPDTFKPSPIDLRVLNEKAAGEGGFIVAKGEDFIHSKTGQPTRFWAVNTGMDTVFLDRSSIDYFARSLAKQGVNLVPPARPALEGRQLPRGGQGQTGPDFLLCLRAEAGGHLHLFLHLLPALAPTQGRRRFPWL